MQNETPKWQTMKTAPKNGTRILAVIRGGQQSVADVDVVRWTRPGHAVDPCWVSTESTHDCPIAYEDWEVINWMPLPDTISATGTSTLAEVYPPPAEGAEAGGSGI